MRKTGAGKFLWYITGKKIIILYIFKLLIKLHFILFPGHLRIKIYYKFASLSRLWIDYDLTIKKGGSAGNVFQPYSFSRFPQGDTLQIILSAMSGTDKILVEIVYGIVNQVP